MRKEQAYPSDWIKATADSKIGIPGLPESFVGTIWGDITTHKWDDGRTQRVVRFKEIPELKLGLNMTNWDTIAKIADQPDDEDWAGTVIELFVVPEKASDSGHAIRIKKPSAATVKAFGPERAEKVMGAIVSFKGRIEDLREFLVFRGVHPVSLASGPVEKWPEGWAAAINFYLKDPAGAMLEVSSGKTEIDEDSIPF